MNRKPLGRVVGGLVLLQLAGLIVPFILILPVTKTDYLQNAAAAEAQIRTAVLLFYVNSGITLAIALAAFPVLRATGERLAVSLAAVSVIWFVLQAVDSAHILSLLSLSQLYRNAGASNPDAFDVLAASAQSARVWAHYAELLVIETWFVVFYFVMGRATLLPHGLALFGIAMALLHALAVSLPKFIGYSSTQMLAPSLMLSHLAAGGWLLAKGFAEVSSPTEEPIHAIV